MVVLPPGTQLQLMYLRERLDLLRRGVFTEVGPGSGEITRVLLLKGWQGDIYDLDSETVERLQTRFARQIAAGELTVALGDYIHMAAGEKVDLIISCMVMEHLNEMEQRAFIAKAATNLRPGGRMIGLVPASPRHWGIEDEIAGHCRRYTRGLLKELMATCGWQLTHVAGLTFPVSNLLLPISNFLVRRAEQSKLALTPLEQTKASGKRRVEFKTHFPSVLGVLLNEITMTPLHFLQKLYKHSERALVLYFEAMPKNQGLIEGGCRHGV